MPYLMHTEFSHAQPQASARSTRRKQETSGPSLYEMCYLQQLAEELNVFLHSKGFTTIQEIHLGISGTDYYGQMKLIR